MLPHAPALLRTIAFACIASAAALIAACPVIYPELKTPLRELRQAETLEPAAPPTVRWVAFRSAKIPTLTRDGRKWGNDLSNGLPDPYAKLLVNGGLLLQSTVQRSTLNPTWPDADSGNFRFHKDDRLRLELWDAGVVSDRPIALREIGTVNVSEVFIETIDVDTEIGVRFNVALERARGRVGYGFFYELRTYDVYVSRVFEESPAARAGMRRGDQIVLIDGHAARNMSEAQLRSHFNARRSEGIKLDIKHSDGTVLHFTLREGAIYPLYREIGSFK